MSARLAVALASTFLVAILAGCAGAGSTATVRFVPASPEGLGAAQAWLPEVAVGLGDPATSGRDRWMPPVDAAPKAFDLDGDGVDELIIQANDTKVYVYRAFTGHVLAVLPTTVPPAWHIVRVLNGVEAGVMRPGEPPSIVVTNHAAYVSSWRFDPAASTADDFAFERQFDVRVNECYASPGMDAKPALGDLDGDGTLEVVVQTEERGFYALRADGSTLWRQCWGGGNSAPVIADLDGDSRAEVIVGSDGGFLAVLDGRNGGPLWTFDVKSTGVTPGSITVSPTVADLDGVPPLEVLFTARHAPDDVTDFSQDHFAIFAVHQDPLTYQAVLLWMRQPDWGNPLTYTQLVVADVDRDGQPDILGMDWNTIGHSPGDWERLGPAHVFRLTANGEDVWMREMDTWWSNQDIALADLDGDGKLSVLVNGPAGQYDGLWRLSADTGASQGFLPLADWKVTRGPQLFDLRNDGLMQLVVPVQPIDPSRERGALVVFELGVPYAAPWPGFA